MKIRAAARQRLRSRRAGEAGVTLIELLISMVLLVVITGFLVGAVELGRRSFSADQSASATVATASALDALGMLVGAALPTPADNAGPRVAFEGRRDALKFVGLSAGHALPGGPLGFLIRRNGANVELGILPPPGAAALPQAPVLNVVLREVSELSFDYFGSPGTGVTASWQSEWLASNRLPALVRISVGFKDPRRARAPVVVALRQR